MQCFVIPNFQCQCFRVQLEYLPPPLRFSGLHLSPLALARHSQSGNGCLPETSSKTAVGDSGPFIHSMVSLSSLSVVHPYPFELSAKELALMAVLSNRSLVIGSKNMHEEAVSQAHN